MTIIEFWSDSPIENMAGSITNEPDKLILIGDANLQKEREEACARFLAQMNNRTTLVEYRSVVKTKLMDIVQLLNELIRTESDVWIDCTGGDELALVAAGIAYEQNKDSGVQLFKYNIVSGRAYDCDMDGRTVSPELPELSVEDNIILHGGSIVHSDEKPNTTIEWDFDDEFCADIMTMWKIASSNPATWNFQCTAIGAMDQLDETPDRCYMKVYMPLFHREHPDWDFIVDDILVKLIHENLILDFDLTDDFCEIRFKNDQIRDCLTKAGTVLELYTFLTASEMEYKNGNPVFTDLMTGVYLDWDGIVLPPEEMNLDVFNEIDVIMMKGMVPVFVSCKNGNMRISELYKLEAVANRFGSKYAKKVIIATSFTPDDEFRQYVKNRAELMGITIIDQVHTMSQNEFRKQLAAI